VAVEACGITSVALPAMAVWHATRASLVVCHCCVYNFTLSTRHDHWLANGTRMPAVLFLATS